MTVDGFSAKVAHAWTVAGGGRHECEAARIGHRRGQLVNLLVCIGHSCDRGGFGGLRLCALTSIKQPSDFG
jgi:hypothetical protein